MSFLKRLLGKTDPPKQRIRVCVECGMPLAEHKDWCSIHRAATEMKLKAAGSRAEAGRIAAIPVALILAAALAQSAAGATIDLTIPPGANFDKAEFRLWYPPSTQTVQATLVLVPGSTGAARPMAAEPFWQEFAAR